MEDRFGIIGRFASCFTDLRVTDQVEYTAPERLRQQIGALAMGYEDLNDHDDLRFDPVHALIDWKKGCGRFGLPKPRN
ncbi:MAG: transposase [Puniceicoccaceae bacterium]